MTEKKSNSVENEILLTLQELLKWTKASSYRAVKDSLNSILDTETKKLIYQFSDGTLGSTEVVRKAKSSSQTVSDCWKMWKKSGIGETIKVTGGERFKRIFDLDDFDLLPKSKKNLEVQNK